MTSYDQFVKILSSQRPKWEPLYAVAYLTYMNGYVDYSQREWIQALMQGIPSITPEDFDDLIEEEDDISVDEQIANLVDMLPE